MNLRVLVSLVALALAGCASPSLPDVISMLCQAAPGAGLRAPTKPFLNMPETANGTMPARLSQTGAFADVRRLTPAAGMLPYDLVVSFWSDGAEKSRFVAIPQGKVTFSPTGEWRFPRGTVFVKTFTMPADARRPQAGGRRLETRLLVIDRDGGVYGVTYKWRADLSDADLLGEDALTEPVPVRDAGGAHAQNWYYPSREDCLACHNTHTAGQLGPKTRQMNRDFKYADGSTENQLRRWNALGLFSTALNDKDIAGYPTLAQAADKKRSIEDRARSWIDANCAQCHRPDGTVADFDARYDTPLAQQKLVEGPVLIDQGIDRVRIISPHDPWRSMALIRVNTNDDTRMPPIARNTIDPTGAALLREWMLSLPGRTVAPPPAITPAGGDFKTAVTVTLSSSVAGADIRYTLDGSAPGPTDPKYDKPLKIDGPTVVRARAYKDGLTRSVISQQVYIVEN